MVEIKQALKDIGLTKTETEVYLALVKTSGAQPASLIANKLKMNRTTVYKALLELAKNSLLIKTMKHGITCFYAEDPEEKLKKLIQKKYQRLKEANQKIGEQLPALIAKSEAYDERPQIRYYEGIEGIKDIYELILKSGKDYYRYGDITKIYKALGQFTDEYIKKRKKLNITAHAIMPYKKRGNQNKTRERNQKELRKTLYIDEKLFPIDGEVRVFDNKVAILSLKKESPIGVVIESDVIAKMFKSIFMLSWKNHKKAFFKL